MTPDDIKYWLNQSPEAKAAQSTPAATWREKGEPDPHGSHYDGERAALTLGKLTDDELANGAYMNYDARMSFEDILHPKPGQNMPIVWMTAVKERIRWLSRALVAESQRLSDKGKELSKLRAQLHDAHDYINELERK